MKRPRLILISALVLTVLAAPAYAKRGEGHGKEKHQAESIVDHEGKPDRHHDRDRDRENNEHRHHFNDQRRGDIHAFLLEDYHRRCPPGLAKKHNGCRPPGQAKKYTIGGLIPSGYHHLPEALIVRIGPPPPGAYYAMVDNDVLLVSEASKKIIDAVTLLSAVGN